MRLLLDRVANLKHATRRHPPLHPAAFMNRIAVVRLLLDTGYKEEATEATRTTALDEAARFNATGFIKLLLDAGLKIEATSTQHCPTPLVEAAR